MQDIVVLRGSRDGIRDSKTVGTTVYKYITQNGKVIRQTWNGNTLDIVYDNSGLPFACLYNNEYYSYVLNLQGDVIWIVDETGAVADVAVQVATTGTVDIGQTMIAAGAGAISGACALIPGGTAVTTIVSGVINGALGAGSYALNQIRQGKTIDAEGLISNTVSGFVGGVVGNLLPYTSTSATREMAEALLDKGARKIATGVASTVKRGAQYVLRGTNMLMNYAQQAGTNSGFGSVVGAIINPFISEAMATW